MTKFIFTTHNLKFFPSSTKHSNHLHFKIIYLLTNFCKVWYDEYRVILLFTYVVQKYKEIPDMDALGMEKRHIDILLKNGEMCLAATERLT